MEKIILQKQRSAIYADHNNIPSDGCALTQRDNFYHNTLIKNGRPKVILQGAVNHRHINFRINHAKKNL